MNGGMVVCIGVCTVKRPALLARCLSSLAAQRRPEGIELHIVVVDNDATPSSKPVADSFLPACPFPIHYRHEPRRGIPMARNRVITEALALNADWLAYIDDDQAAHTDWLEMHLHAAARDQADVVAPHVIYRYPQPRPFWCFAESPASPAEDGPVEARLRNRAATNGVMLSAKLIRADGMGLRFDERLALGGEEDGEFFGAAFAQGARIVGSSLPVLDEEAHRSRFTYRRYCLRGLGRGGAYVTRHRIKNGYWPAVRRYAGMSIVRALKGMAQLTISPVFLPFAMRRFKFTALEGGRNILIAAGAIGGLLLLQYEYYRRIDGY